MLFYGSCINYGRKAWKPLKPDYTFFVRHLDKTKQKQLSNACNEVIELLRVDLSLKQWECYFVVKTLYDSFPMEGIVDEDVLKA